MLLARHVGRNNGGRRRSRLGDLVGRAGPVGGGGRRGGQCRLRCWGVRGFAARSAHGGSQRDRAHPSARVRQGRRAAPVDEEPMVQHPRVRQPARRAHGPELRQAHRIGPFELPRPSHLRRRHDVRQRVQVRLPRETCTCCAVAAAEAADGGGGRRLR